MGQIGLPKALIEIEGRTLLERSIESLKAIGVSKVIVVVGHLGDKIIDFIFTNHSECDARNGRSTRQKGLRLLCYFTQRTLSEMASRAK